MSKVVINYDTKEKMLDVSLDGKKIKDVYQIYIYNYEINEKEEAHIEITSVEGNEEEGLYRRYCIYANREEQSVILKPFTSNNTENLGKKLAESMRVKL